MNRAIRQFDLANAPADVTTAGAAFDVIVTGTSCDVTGTSCDVTAVSCVEELLASSDPSGFSVDGGSAGVSFELFPFSMAGGASAVSVFSASSVFVDSCSGFAAFSSSENRQQFFQLSRHVVFFIHSLRVFPKEHFAVSPVVRIRVTQVC